MASSKDLFINVLDLPSKIEQQMESWITNSTSVSIFITGKTGTGKSTLVNSIVGSVVSPESHTVYPETDEVLQLPPKVINGIQVNVWDSPGLQDGTQREEEYLHDIKANCKGKADLILYCVDMSKARFVPGNRDIIAMKKLSETLGEDMWKITLIVLTFANRYVWKIEDDFEDDPKGLQQKFDCEVDSWKDLIHSALKKEVRLDAELVKTIKIVPAGDYHSKTLPGDVCWLSNVWGKAFTVTRPLAQPAFVKISENRLNRSIDPECSSSYLTFEQPLLLANIGKIIGEKIGVPEIGFKIGLGRTIAESFLCSYYKLHNGYFSVDSAGVSVDTDDYNH